MSHGLAACYTRCQTVLSFVAMYTPAGASARVSASAGREGGITQREAGASHLDT